MTWWFDDVAIIQVTVKWYILLLKEKWYTVYATNNEKPFMYEI